MKISLLGSRLFEALFLFVCICSAIPAEYVLHERRHFDIPSEWNKGDRVKPHTVVPVSIGLLQNNLHFGEEYLMDVSDPHSPNYSKYWTQEEVISKFAPSEETVKIVKAWLYSASIDLDRVIHHDNKGWLVFYARMDELESLIHSEYFEYSDGDTLSLSCERYYLPSYVSPHIDYINPGVRISGPSQKRRTQQKELNPSLEPSMLKRHPESGTLTDCWKLITPQCIRALYNIPAERPSVVVNNSFGIYETFDTWDQSDLNAFFERFTPYIPQDTHPITKSIDGGRKGQYGINDTIGEAGLDFEVAYPIVYPNELIEYSVDDKFYVNHDVSTGLFNTFLDALDGSYCQYKAFGIKGDSPTIDPTYPDPHKGGYKGKLECGVYKPAKVISISWGSYENFYPENYQKRQCNEFMKLALQGTSFFIASGDYGVQTGENPECLGGKGIFSPAMGLCPYITVVGGTQLNPHTLPSHGEVAVIDYTNSSGGFSNIFSRPKYQDAMVGSYFTNYRPKYKSYAEFGLKDFHNRTGRYNRLGRGYPDVAAAARNIAVHVLGRYRLSGGTSSATPIWAAIISRINGERILAGKSSVGFINPVLYKYPEVLNDITSGHNPGCKTPGFHCERGWDPVTGLGTPNYEKLLKLFMNLP